MIYCFFQEGPHSALCDEEFYDAVESGLDKLEEENQLKDRLKLKSVVTSACVSSELNHPLWPEVGFEFVDKKCLILYEKLLKKREFIM